MSLRDLWLSGSGTVLIGASLPILREDDGALGYRPLLDQLLVEPHPPELMNVPEDEQAISWTRESGQCSLVVGHESEGPTDLRLRESLRVLHSADDDVFRLLSLVAVDCLNRYLGWQKFGQQLLLTAVVHYHHEVRRSRARLARFPQELLYGKSFLATASSLIVGDHVKEDAWHSVLRARQSVCSDSAVVFRSKGRGDAGDRSRVQPRDDVVGQQLMGSIDPGQHVRLRPECLEQALHIGLS